MAESKCSIKGCPNPARARGWCRRHYQCWYSTGDPLGNRRNTACAQCGGDMSLEPPAADRCQECRKPRPRSCEDCGKDISALHGNARYCTGCSERRQEPGPRLRDAVGPALMTVAELAYWAGLIDGEGSFGIKRDVPRPSRMMMGNSYIGRFSIAMTDRDLVARFAADFGMTVQDRPIGKNKLAKRAQWAAGVSGYPACVLAQTVLPYLHFKRRQAELVIALEEEKRQPGLRTRYAGTHTYRRGTVVVTRKRYATAQEHLDRWDGYWREVKALNRPGRDVVLARDPDLLEG
jgi:hypothetical protein